MAWVLIDNGKPNRVSLLTALEWQCKAPGWPAKKAGGRSNMPHLADLISWLNTEPNSLLLRK